MSVEWIDQDTYFMIVPTGMVVGDTSGSNVFVPLDKTEISLNLHKPVEELSKEDMEKWVLDFYGVKGK